MLPLKYKEHTILNTRGTHLHPVSRGKTRNWFEFV